MFLSLGEDLFFGLHLNLDRKTVPILSEDLFFGLYLFSGSKTVSILGKDHFSLVSNVKTTFSHCLLLRSRRYGGSFLGFRAVSL